MEKYFEINDSGFNIRCKLYCNDVPAVKTVILFFHGFSGHKDNRSAASFAAGVLKKHDDAALITFNWPCHGDDVREKLQLSDCLSYLARLVAYCKTTFRCDRFFAYATSFGGYVLLKYIEQAGNPFDKIALRCPAVQMYHVLTQSIVRPETLAELKEGRGAYVGFDRKILITQAFLHDLQAADITGADYLHEAEKMLIVHGTRDEIVPFLSVRDFARRNQIGFIPVEDADHRFVDPLLMDVAAKHIMAFFGLS